MRTKRKSKASIIKEPNKYLRFNGYGLPKDTKVVHFFPNAYCLAVEGLCATFAVPPQKNRLIASTEEYYGAYQGTHGFTFYQDEKWKPIKCEVGKWYSLAYVSTEGRGETIALEHQPNACKNY